MNTRSLLLVIALIALVPAAARAVDDPWADEVLQYTPGPGALFTDPSLALGAPEGGGPTTPNNGSIVSLGAPGGVLVLKFNTPVTDDPLNPFGLDCIVYSNAFWVGGNPQVKWQEPCIIEISEDVNGNGIADDPWYLIPGSRAFAYSPFPSVSEPAGQSNSSSAPYLLAGHIQNPNLFDANPANDNIEYNWGYGKLSPTLLPFLDNYVRPDDPHTVGMTPRSGGGDAFDIAWAVDAAGNPAHLTRFHFIRLTSFISRNMGPLGIASPDIEAVADVAPDVDTDSDGIVDEYETRVAGTDPLRKESTVLALEIPAIEGGSAPGAILGTAEDSRGTKLRLYADQQRTEEGREYSVKVDILAPAEPGTPLPTPSLHKSQTVREIVSSESDFVAAGIQSAEVTIHYLSAEIAGLDEAGLQPYLHTGSAYTQSGISNVSVNAAANLVTFRTRYAGLFLLASIAGAGDTGSGIGPQGTIALTASPPDHVTADPANTVTVTSGMIRDQSDQIVPDGTRITVAASGGSITTADADLSLPGIQVTTAGGVITFTIQAPTQSGPASITATSVEGAAYGDLTYTFTPGPPAPSVTWSIRALEGDGPVEVTMISGIVHDRFGNPVQDGTLLTVDVQGAAIASGDADLTRPGTQVIVSSGRAVFVVEADAMSSVFGITTHDTATVPQLLGQGTYSPANYQAVPLQVSGAIAALILLVAIRRRHGGRSPS